MIAAADQATHDAINGHIEKFRHMPGEACGDIGDDGLKCAVWRRFMTARSKRIHVITERHRKRNKLERKRRKAGRR